MKSIIVLILFMTLSSCNYSRTSGGTPSTDPQGGLSDPNRPGEELAVRFADVKANVLDKSCAGCHQAIGLDLSFADYTNTKSFAAQILNRVFVVRDMPRGNKLTVLQEQVLRTWLDAGAPE